MEIKSIRYLILTLTLIFVFTSCEKTDNVDDSMLIGKWYLEYFIGMPDCYKGTWVELNADNTCKGQELCDNSETVFTGVWSFDGDDKLTIDVLDMLYLDSVCTVISVNENELVVSSLWRGLVNAKATLVR